MKALRGIEDVGVNRRVLHRFIGVIYSHMPIHNAAIQLTGMDSRATFDCERLFPHGGAFPHGEVGVHDAPHWIDRDTICGELGVFGKGGGKKEIFGGDRQVNMSLQSGNTSPTRGDSWDLCLIVIFPAIPPLFPTKLKHIART